VAAFPATTPSVTVTGREVAAFPACGNRAQFTLAGVSTKEYVRDTRRMMRVRRIM
jgi:hypothetical protein